MSSRLSRPTLVTLLVLACLGMVLQAGSVPHVHEAHEPGIYNEEHDLTLLAALAAHALLSDAAPLPAPAAVVSAPTPVVWERPATSAARSADSRAPPAA